MDSYVAVKAYMEETNKYDQEDLKNVDAFIEENAKTARLEMHQKADENLPTGWRLEVKNSSDNLIVSPDGTIFSSRMLALQHMMLKNFPKEDVSQMESSLKEEGWRLSELLPKGWLFKKGRLGAGIQMFSSKGEHFETCTKAKQSLASDSNSREKDIKNMEKLINDTIMTNRSKNKRSSQCYLPDGWQSRMEGKKEVFSWLKELSSVSVSLFLQVFLSPDGSKCSNLRLALMKISREGTYSKEEVYWGRL